ncbi:MAG TPA: response regulator [Gemmataceae bacterium]|nr:response regulator [Gemmataceae bacterium]
MNTTDSHGLARALFDEAGDALLLFDPQTDRLLDVNPTAERLTGMARAELMRQPATYLFRFGGQGGMQRLRQACHETIAFHSQDGFYLRTRQDGVWIPVNITVTRLHVQPRTLALVTARDMREYKRAEEELARERNLLRALMDHLPDHIFVKDTRSRFVTANAATVQTLGAKSLEDILNKTDFDFLPQERAQQFYADEQTVVRTGRPLLNREELLIDAAGRRKWLLTTKAPFRDGNGAVVGLVGMSHDVTERREAEEERAGLLAREQQARAEAEAAMQALRASEEQYRSLAEAIPQIVWTAKADGAVDFYNRRWFEYTGTTLEQTGGWGWGPVIHPEDLQRVVALWTEALRTAEPFEIETRFRRASDGAYRWHLCRAVPVLERDGRVVKWFGGCTDIDDQKRAAEAMHQAKEAAETANRAKSEFLANMSHEIRTPMNGIIGMTELALETNLTREQREYLMMVKASADALLAVINDILDFSRIEARKLHLEAVDFPLRDHLGDMLKALAVRAEERGLELACHIAPDVPEVVVGDPTRLRQVVVNLVGNALKFTERGEVVVEVRRASADYADYAEKKSAESADVLLFSVRDTGIGIPPDKQKLIFDAFSQADASTTRKYGGTGLGLAITTQLVQMMGGRIWVESEVGKGSTFHFTARFGAATGSAPRPPAAEPTQLHGLRVLVVDDNATNRRILEEVLRNWGLRPTAVDGGQSALAAMEHAACAGEPFRLVLLDGHMPEMDGFTLAEHIRRDRERADVALVMLTSAGRPDDVVRCRQLGIDAYLMKPVKQSELFDAVLTAASAVPRPTSRLEADGSAARDGQATAESGQSARALRVLLAEDHPVNQKLAVRLLEKRGCSVAVVGDGKEALAALERQPFDLVLMDVQMPDMDGFETAGRIRQGEQASGKRLPILAMTAYAMKGDRERCLAAGMDGYVSKPIQPQELFDAIDRLFPPSQIAPGAHATRLAEPSSESVVGREEALRRVGGDVGLLADLARMFLDAYPQQMTELRAAAGRGDGSAVQRLAHTIKGAVGTFGAGAAFEAALRLEKAARAGDLTHAEQDGAALEEALAQMRPALSAWGAEGDGK